LKKIFPNTDKDLWMILILEFVCFKIWNKNSFDNDLLKEYIEFPIAFNLGRITNLMLVKYLSYIKLKLVISNLKILSYLFEYNRKLQNILIKIYSKRRTHEYFNNY